MVSLPEDLAQAVEDYRFANRISTEAETIRRLIEAGLNASGKRSGGKQGVQGKGLPATTLGRAATESAPPSSPKKPRAKAAAMSKEVQIRALRERS